MSAHPPSAGTRLLDKAHARGVILSARGETLVVDGPAAAVNRILRSLPLSQYVTPRLARCPLGPGSNSHRFAPIAASSANTFSEGEVR